MTDGDNFERARELVLLHGWNSTCFQIVNPGLEYWFGPGDGSVVAYVDSGRVRVVAGAPVSSAADFERVTTAFEAASAATGRTVCYFGAEGRLEDLVGGRGTHSKVLLGAQPVWHPGKWEELTRSSRSLRAQFNRARNKGVTISEWPGEKAHDSRELRDCLEAWLEIKGLPALHFVIEPETLRRLEHRRVFVAEYGSRVVAFLVLSPVPQRSGWLTEQFPHRPEAPNGTVELMMDTAVRTLAEEGYKYVTLGLSPLSRRAKIEKFDNPVWLRFLLAWMRKHGQRFYNFDGLDSFKAKMMPEYWEPVFAISNEAEFSGRTMWGIANAFTNNRPFRVIGGGLRKAVVAEFANFRRFLTSRHR